MIMLRHEVASQLLAFGSSASN